MKRKSFAVLAWIGAVGITGAISAGQDAKKDAKASNVAAYLGDAPITIEELDAKVLKTNMKLAQDLYNARRAAVDEVILDRALAGDAKAKGVTVDQLLKEKIASKASPVTDADVSAYFESNKGRMGGKTLEQVSGQIKNYLVSQKETEAKNIVLNEIKNASKVRITLDAPRADFTVAANEPMKGSPNAKVTILEYSEYQ